MKLSVSFDRQTRYDIVTGRHRMVTDQPIEDGGQDAGPSPVELFVGSLASCVAYFVGSFCARHHIPYDDLSIDVEWNMAEHPHRVGQIDLAIHLPHCLSSEVKERLLKVAHGCTVHQSLLVMPTVGIKVA